jgi:hypothetical protein
MAQRKGGAGCAHIVYLNICSNNVGVGIQELSESTRCVSLIRVLHSISMVALELANQIAFFVVSLRYHR